MNFLHAHSYNNSVSKFNNDKSRLEMPIAGIECSSIRMIIVVFSAKVSYGDRCRKNRVSRRLDLIRIFPRERKIRALNLRESERAIIILTLI